MVALLRVRGGCILNRYVFILSTQYYTNYEYQPVRDIAQASLTGHGTNIITGVAVGMKSTVVPVITVSCAVLITYYLSALWCGDCSLGRPVRHGCRHHGHAQ